MSKSNIILAFIFILALTLLSYKATYSFFSNQATSTGNVFAAASAFPTATPSATPTPIPVTSNLYDSNSYSCSGGAATLDSSFGSVTILVGTSDLSINVTLSNATPNSSYDIWVNQDPGACPLSTPSFTGDDALLTDSSGNGTKSYTITKFSGATKFWISAVGGSQVLRSVAGP